MEVKLGDLIKYKGHICKVRYIYKDLHPNRPTCIEFDTPDRREYESIDKVQLSPFTNDTVIFTQF